MTAKIAIPQLVESKPFVQYGIWRIYALTAARDYYMPPRPTYCHRTN